MSHWTTSGKLRLQEQQKRSFRMRAHYAQSRKRVRTHPSDQFIQYDHPMLRKRPAVDGIRMSLANPIARRGIVVTAENPQRHRRSPLAPCAANLGGMSNEKRGIRNFGGPRPNSSAPGKEEHKAQSFQTFHCQPRYQTIGSCRGAQTHLMPNLHPVSSRPPPTAVSLEHSTEDSARSSMYDSLDMERLPEKNHFLLPIHRPNPCSSENTYGSAQALSHVTPQSSKQRVSDALALAHGNLWHDRGRDSSWDKGKRHHDLPLSRELGHEHCETLEPWLDHIQEANTSHQREQYIHNRLDCYSIHRSCFDSDLAYDDAQLARGETFRRHFSVQQARELAITELPTQKHLLLPHKRATWPIVASTTSSLAEVHPPSSSRVLAAVKSLEVERIVDEKAHNALLTFLDADDESHTAPEMFQRVNLADDLSTSQLHPLYDNPGSGNPRAHNTNLESSKGFSRFKKLKGGQQSTNLTAAQKNEPLFTYEKSNRQLSFDSPPETPSRLRFFMNGTEVDIDGTPISTPLSPGWMHF